MIFKHVCFRTLSDLGVSYVDLYLIHWPMAFKRGQEIFPRNEDGSLKYDGEVDPVDTYLAMEKLVEKGLAKAIGVSNFNEAQIEAVLEKAKVKPATNQVESHPYFNQAKLLTFLKEKDILLTAYSPLGSPDRPWALPDEPVLLEHTDLKAVAEKHGKTAAQVALRWQLQRGVAVIPKSVTPARIEQNLAVHDFELSAEEMAKLNALDQGQKGRMVCPRDSTGQFRDRAHPHFPFKGESL